MKKTLFLIGLFTCLCTQQMLAVTTALSSLHNPKTGMRITVLHDMHLAQLTNLVTLPGDTEKEINNILDRHNNDLKNLVTLLEQEDQELSFLGEVPSFALKMEYLDTQGSLQVVPKIFVQSESNKRGSITFIAADLREETDFRALEIRWRNAELKNSLEEGSLEESFLSITIEFYIEHLKNVINNLLQTLDSLCLDSSTTNNLKEVINTLDTKIDSYIEFALEEYGLQKSDHLIDLYEKELQYNRAHLINMSEQVSNLQFDIEFLSLILNNPAKKIVVQVGAIHAKFIIYQLLKVGYDIINEYGSIDDLVVDEYDRVDFKVKYDKIDLETIKEIQAKTLDNIDQLVINCLKDSLKSAGQKNFL